jgi:hypothetical protein
MSSEGFEPVIPLGERTQTHALDRAAHMYANKVLINTEIFVLVLIGMASVLLAKVARRWNDAGGRDNRLRPLYTGQNLEQGGLTGPDFYKLDQQNAHNLIFSFTQLLHISGHTRFCTDAPPDGGSLRPETCRSFVN